MERYHFWLITQDEDKRPYLIYGCPASKGEDEARTHGLEILGGMDFEIRKLPTRSIQKASSIIRGSRLEKTHSLKEAKKRIGHNKSIKKLMHRFSDW